MEERLLPDQDLNSTTMLSSDMLLILLIRLNIYRIFTFLGENQIYFECGEKISIFHECIAQVKMLIFSPLEMEYIWYSPKKVNFLILYSSENTGSTL